MTAEPWGQRAPAAGLIPAECPPLRQVMLSALTDAANQVTGREAILVKSLLPLAQRKIAEYSDEQVNAMVVQAHGMLTDYLTRAGLL